MTGFLFVVVVSFWIVHHFYVFPLIKEIVPTYYYFMTKKEPFLWNRDCCLNITSHTSLDSSPFEQTNEMQNYLSPQGQNLPWQKLSEKATCCCHEPLIEDRPGWVWETTVSDKTDYTKHRPFVSYVSFVYQKYLAWKVDSNMLMAAACFASLLSCGILKN